MADTLTAKPVVRPGIYARGSKTVDAILKAALTVLINEGAAQFTLRRVASECGLKGGNVSYHFPRKEMLLQVLIEELLKSGEDLTKRTFRQSGMSAEDTLAVMIGGVVLDETSSKRTTHLCTELWAMANHDGFIAERVESSYRSFQAVIGKLVAKINPALSPEDIEAVSLFICSSMEGMTIVSGFGKPWQSELPQIKAIAVSQLVHLAKTVTPTEIQLFRSAV